MFVCQRLETERSKRADGSERGGNADRFISIKGAVAIVACGFTNGTYNNKNGPKSELTTKTKRNDKNREPNEILSSHTLYGAYATTTLSTYIAAIQFTRTTIGPHLPTPSTSLSSRHSHVCACLSRAECTSLLERRSDPFVWLAIKNENPPNDSPKGQQQR